MVAFINITCDDPTDKMMYDAEVIQECFFAMNEGASDPIVYDTAQKYTKSLLTSVLQFVYDALNKAVAVFLKSFHAFIVNDVRIAGKYKDIIISKMKSRSIPIHYETYSYEGLYEYPKDVRQSVFDTNEIVKIMKNVKAQEQPGSITLAEYVDKKIVEFGQAVIGDKIDPDDLEYSVRNKTHTAVCGGKTTKTLSAGNLNEFYKDMENTVKEYKKARQLKAQITNYYKMLKHEIDEIYAIKSTKRNPGNPNFRDASVTIHEDPITDTKIALQKNRLLNSYIQIYKVAFTEKIDCCREKIQNDSQVIAELLKLSATFGGSQVADPVKYSAMDRTGLK